MFCNRAVVIREFTSKLLLILIACAMLAGQIFAGLFGSICDCERHGHSGDYLCHSDAPLESGMHEPHGESAQMDWESERHGAKFHGEFRGICNHLHHFFHHQPIKLTALAVSQVSGEKSLSPPVWHPLLTGIQSGYDRGFPPSQTTRVATPGGDDLSAWSVVVVRRTVYLI